jgi:hypothetical protein
MDAGGGDCRGGRHWRGIALSDQTASVSQGRDIDAAVARIYAPARPEFNRHYMSRASTRANAFSAEALHLANHFCRGADLVPFQPGDGLRRRAGGRQRSPCANPPGGAPDFGGGHIGGAPANRSGRMSLVTAAHVAGPSGDDLTSDAGAARK